MKQHKWHKEIKAWADGAEIETRYRIWLDAGGFQWGKWLIEPKIPNWELTDCEYRIKPQPKEPQYLYVYWDFKDDEVWFSIKNDYELTKYPPIGKIKIEVDDD